MRAISVKKEEVQKILDRLPDTIVINDFISEIVLMAKIEAALEECRNGEGTDWEDVKKEMDSW